MANENNRNDGFIDRTVKIKRCAAVVKGGRRFSFAAMVVVGDGKGRVGWGYAKANEVPPAVEKAQKQATRSLVTVPLVEGTIPHTVKIKFGPARVLLMPAGPGTGVIAGAAVRAVRGCGHVPPPVMLSTRFASACPVTVTVLMPIRDRAFLKTCTAMRQGRF